MRATWNEQRRYRRTESGLKSATGLGPIRQRRQDGNRTIITLQQEFLPEIQTAHSLQITIYVEGKRWESEVLTTFNHPVPLWPLDREEGQ